jgi:hypothetical protein
MRLKPKAIIISRQRTGPPDIRVYLAERMASRRQTPPPEETDLAALIARGRFDRERTRSDG